VRSTATIEARAEDRSLIRETRDAMSRSIGRVDGIVERAPAADQQIKWLIWSGVAGVIIGMFSGRPARRDRPILTDQLARSRVDGRADMGMDGPHAAARLIEVSRPLSIEIRPTTTNQLIRRNGASTRALQ